MWLLPVLPRVGSYTLSYAARRPRSRTSPKGRSLPLRAYFARSTGLGGTAMSGEVLSGLLATSADDSRPEYWRRREHGRGGGSATAELGGIVRSVAGPQRDWRVIFRLRSGRWPYPWSTERPASLHMLGRSTEASMSPLLRLTRGSAIEPDPRAPHLATRQPARCADK